MRGATVRLSRPWECRTYFNPRPPCGGRRINLCQHHTRQWISIHAPRAGGDQKPPVMLKSEAEFQSTPPVRGATNWRRAAPSPWLYFNPRPPCGGRPLIVVRLLYAAHFNPRPPCGGRRRAEVTHWMPLPISIHAPRAGGDGVLVVVSDGGVRNFNPRPPCGGRPYSGLRATIQTPGFQSTPPVRGATHMAGRPRIQVQHFNPRPPCGGRPLIVVRLLYAAHFNPRPPCGGRRSSQVAKSLQNRISIHAPRAGGDE